MTWRELEAAIAALPDSILDSPAQAQLPGTTPPPLGQTYDIVGLQTPAGAAPYLLLAVPAAIAAAAASRPTPRIAAQAARK